ncbi:MAG TPA: excinuclease ABC subunit UvrB [Candidatus Altiarchaeales archaeon]|nr:excinuclease ABC subunit UvrB [Candidatus Altiarchaeales archaeon]
MDFKIRSSLSPSGSQPEAIRLLVDGIESGMREQTLLGVTGSGKTFTMANVIEKTQKPAIVLAPNKTLAAQLYSEFKELFPGNAVEYFVSYYDYYQPEAYLPASDTYIAKDADINAEIEKLRHRTTSSLLDRNDVIVVATVSAIYGLGSPQEYKNNTLHLKVGEHYSRDRLLEAFVNMHYERNDKNLVEGKFRVRGGQIDVYPPYSENIYRIKVDENIASIRKMHAVSGRTLEELEQVRIYPSVHYLLDERGKAMAIEAIVDEMNERVVELNNAGKIIEANRLKQKTLYDVELIEELGYCKGIENYSRHLEGRNPGEPPNTLLDFFPKDFLCFIDESHIAVPQVRGMHNGDRARKETLIAYGFRLPSALDNRPLTYDEFDARLKQVVYVSATPGEFELSRSRQVVEQIIRPTGLIDPLVEVRPAKDQVEDFIKELELRVMKGERVLATTLTKRMSEDLSDFLHKKEFKVKYLHSEIDTLERVDILRELREGKIEVVVGVNLLREGLDLPEVTLVAIMDADQEGFLRSARSLIQTIGRCSRNVEGKVILYADKVTDSMRKALSETSRRREIQLEYNQEHGITPTTIIKKIHERIVEKEEAGDINEEVFIEMPVEELTRLMRDSADKMDFEQAIMLRDMIEARKTGKKDLTTRKSGKTKV